MKFSFRLIALICCSVLLSVAQPLVAQQTALDTLKKKFDTYRKENLHEKIYLHLDRPSYLTGETMWFKIYLSDATLHKPLGLSKVAYIEIIDGTKQPVLQTKIEMKEGVGAGSLYLPATLGSGHYTVRAYTSWMKNFSAEFYFHKAICIINTFKSLDVESPAAASGYDAQFFPEGGNLVAGIKTKVAFRVIGSDGRGIDFNGTLVDEQNNTILAFTPLKFGIGHFSFTPQPNRQYHALLRDGAGKTQSVALPSVQPMGYSLKVSDTTNNQLQIKVSSNGPHTADVPWVYLLVHARNRISATAYQSLRNGSALFLVDTKKMAEGISHITVFDASMNPVCERLYFKKTESHLDIAIKPNHADYEPRQSVQIDLTSAVKQAPKAAQLSVSVYRTDSLPSFAGNMVDYFWLTSDLKGTIESPEYYLSSSPETKEAVDNLMLTHGWRRFVWSDVLGNRKSTPEFMPEYRGHIVQGTVVKEDDSPAKGITAYLSSPSKVINMYPSRSSTDGTVQFEMQHFYGSSKIIAQTNPKYDSTYSIKIKSPFSTQLHSHTLPRFALSPSLEKQLLSRSVAMQVQDIYFAQEQAKIKSPLRDSLAFYGKADKIYRLDDYNRFTVMEEVMREYVPTVFVRKRKDGFHFVLTDEVGKKVLDEPALVLLDGVPVFDEDDIMAFSPLRIKKLEVVNRKWYMGPFRFNGIVSYSTYQGDLGGFVLHPKSVMLDYDGLQLHREFYSPKYETQAQRESRLPDRRYLLHWNPFVVTDKDGNGQVVFTTSDVRGEFKIVVEGMTNAGDIGSTTSSFTVKKVGN